MTQPDFRGRALQKIERQEAETYAREQQQIAEAQAQVNRQADAQDQAVERDVVKRLHALQPRYEARRIAAVAGDVCQFFLIEREIVGVEDRIAGELEGIWRRHLYPPAMQSRLVHLRQAAGLPANHGNLGLDAPSDDAERLMRTILVSIVNKVLGPGFVVIGGNMMQVG